MRVKHLPATLLESNRQDGRSVSHMKHDWFTELYSLHVERVYRYHLSRTGDIQLAQDLNSETFHAAFENQDKYRPIKGSQFAWLMGIAHHKLVDHLRRSKLTVSIDRAEKHFYQGLTPEESATRGLQISRVAAALARLKDERAEAIMLHFFAGMSLRETGEVMGKSSEAIKKLVQRGLADLRQQFVLQEED